MSKTYKKAGMLCVSWVCLLVCLLLVVVWYELRASCLVAGALPLEPVYWRKQIWLQIEDRSPSACHLRLQVLQVFWLDLVS
jgi:4-hydroxybenzoate polyprenyltransferase